MPISVVKISPAGGREFVETVANKTLNGKHNTKSGHSENGSNMDSEWKMIGVDDNRKETI